jgi:hypothetical protein
MPKAFQTSNHPSFVVRDLTQYIDCRIKAHDIDKTSTEGKHRASLEFHEVANCLGLDPPLRT